MFQEQPLALISMQLQIKSCRKAVIWTRLDGLGGRFVQLAEYAPTNQVSTHRSECSYILTQEVNMLYIYLQALPAPRTNHVFG